MSNFTGTKEANYLPIIEQRIKALIPGFTGWHINPNQMLTGDDWIVETHHGRRIVVYVSKELFDDLRDNTSSPNSEYSHHLIDKLDGRIIKAIKTSAVVFSNPRMSLKGSV